jgi:uncharacterized protein (DUF952 family)
MIYHIVKEKDYRSRNDGNKFLPSNFNENGFVHCALETSVIPVANEYYSNVEEMLLLLRIDPLKLNSQTKYESATPETGVGTSHLISSIVFPHVYGPIDNSAVDGIGILTKDKNGYVWPKKFISIAEYINGDNKTTA